MPIHYESRDDHIVVITIDRPEARNALDMYHFSDLAQSWRRFKDDPDAWVAVITGVGDAVMAGAPPADVTPPRDPASQRDAPRAVELGLINEIVSEGELLDRAIDWAHRITANAPLAVQATKESVLRCLALDLQAAYDLEQEISSKVFQSKDAKEGPQAFAEKRP